MLERLDSAVARLETRLYTSSQWVRWCMFWRGFLPPLVDWRAVARGVAFAALAVLLIVGAGRAVAQPSGWTPGSASPQPVASGWTYESGLIHVSSGANLYAGCSTATQSPLPNTTDCEFFEGATYADGQNWTMWRPFFFAPAGTTPPAPGSGSGGGGGGTTPPATVTGTVTIACTPPLCLSEADGALVSAAIASLWLVAFGIKALLTVMRDRDDE